MIRGIDVSHHTGTVNWKTKRAQYGLDFGAAKCTEGTGFFDSQYVANREGCHLAGMPFIPYHYADPGASTALTQAQRFVAKAGTCEGYCLDLEKSSLGQPETNAWMRQFGDDLRALVGETTIVYLGGYAANGSGQGSVNHFDRWWYPRYPGPTNWPTAFVPRIDANTTGWVAPPAPHIWQFTDNVGGADGNVSNLSLSQLFSGDDVSTPLTQADAELVADVLLARATIASSRVGDPDTPPGEKHSLATWISAIDANAYAAKGLTPDAIAAAVVAALPPAQSGGLTTDQVKQAVKDALKEGTS